jgi:hypothetical protein
MTNATRRSLVSKKQSFGIEFVNAIAARTNIESGSMPAAFRVGRKPHQLAVGMPALPEPPVGTRDMSRAKVEYVWTLTQAAMNGRRKSARALVRELSTLIPTKAKPAENGTVSFEKVSVETAEPKAAVAEQNKNNGDELTEEAMH